MKFDVIVGNPPYNDSQENEGHRGGGGTRWQKFVELSISLLKPNGYLCYVHPCGWRLNGKTGKFKDTQSLLISKKIKYLEIHNAKDGINTFGVGTRYDWYILQNQESNGKTIIMGEDKKKIEFDLNKVPFIPNGMFKEIYDLVAKDGEEKVEIIADSSYHTQGKSDFVSKEKNKEFKYPIIHSIKKAGLNLIYSNTNKNGHFGIPKVVFGRGQSDSYVDYDGQYGLSQDTRAIADVKENLNKINKAINSEKFIKLSSYCCLASTSMFVDKYNKDIISTFRKDFWKSFI